MYVSLITKETYHVGINMDEVYYYCYSDVNFTSEGQAES